MRPFERRMAEFLALAATALLAVPVLAQPDVSWWTVDGGGGTSSGGSFTVRGTIGQPDAGSASGGTFDLRSGFWKSPESDLTVAGAGDGKGTVSGDGITCTIDAGSTFFDCTERVVNGTAVTLVATPDVLNSFGGWSGCDSTSTTSLADDTCHVAPTDDTTVTATFIITSSLGDRVWRDVDGDGVQDADEPGLDGVTVQLDGGGLLLQAVTAAGGFYAFEDLPLDTYTISIDTATLPAGVVATHDLDGTATPHTAAVVLSSDTPRSDVDFGYQPKIDLRVSIGDSADPLPGGQNLIYTITVQNFGPADATGVVLTGSLPAGTALVATTGCAEDPSGVSTCTLGDLAFGAGAVVTIEVSIDPSPPSSITYSVSVSAVETDRLPFNNSGSETTTLDDGAPSVSLVDSEETTDDGEVTDCETIHGREVARLLVTFDEPMLDDAGDTTAGDVTNPESWMLIAAGDDQSLDTTACGALAGDDVEIALGAVGYDAGSMTATITPADSSSLDAGLHRLFACGTGTSVLNDLAGNPLDGDGDGTGGDDFVLRFRADPDNELANGHFDCDLGDWVLESTSAAEIVHGTADAAGSADSGSAAVENLTAGSDFALGQCVAVTARGDYGFDARIRLSTAVAGINAQVVCSYFDASDCGGSEIGSPLGASTELSDTGGAWVTVETDLEAPDLAVSALCSVELMTAAGDSFAADVDQVRLVVLPLFADGFESGGTSAWSSTVP